MVQRLLVALALATAALVTSGQPAARAAQQIADPTAFFGFRIGTDGELARYPKVLDYFKQIADRSDRVNYEELGKTTMGNAFALVTISAPENLRRLDRLVEINRRLADPRGLSDAEAVLIEVKLALSRCLRDRRQRRGVSQVELAKRLRSSQSRVAKMEAGDPSVSMDLLVSALLVLGASEADLAKVIRGERSKDRHAAA